MLDTGRWWQRPHLLINGVPGRCFNATSVTLDYHSLPPPSDSAKHAVSSSISTEFTRINLTIAFGHAHPRGTPLQHKRAEAPSQLSTALSRPGPLTGPPVRLGLALWFDASQIKVQSGSNISVWQDLSGNERDATTPASGPDVDTGPLFNSTGLNGLPSVGFDGAVDSLGNGTKDEWAPRGSGSCELGTEKTIFGVLEDQGSVGECCNGVFTSWFIKNEGGGARVDNLNGISTVADNGQVVLSLDYAGSAQRGFRDIRNQPVVFSATFNDSEASISADACIDGSVSKAVGVPGRYFSIGSRRNEPGRHFKGQISELLVFNRSLSPSEEAAMNNYLAAKWELRSNASCDTNVIFPCKRMLPDSTNTSRFVALLVAHGLQHTLVTEALQLSLGYLDTFSRRCAALNQGELEWTRGHGPAKASLESLLTASKEIHDGAVKQLQRCLSDPMWGGDAVGSRVCDLCRSAPYSDYRCSVLE